MSSKSKSSPTSSSASSKPKKPTLITGKKKIVSIDDILGDDDLFESKQTSKVDHQKAVSKSSSGGAKNSSAPQNAKKRKEPTPDSKPATKAKVDEIDDIFGGMKAVKQQPQQAKPPAGPSQSQQKRPGPFKAAQKPTAPPDDDFWKDSRGTSQKRKKTEDGLSVYTEDELKIGRGGGTEWTSETALCPFDCQCCF